MSVRSGFTIALKRAEERVIDMVFVTRFEAGIAQFLITEAKLKSLNA
jgi:hypothetical protein